MKSIIHLDKYLFYLINQWGRNSILDGVMPLIRTAQFWAPLYLFLFAWILTNFKKNQWWWILFAALLPIATDFISSDLIKNNIFRLRPCNDNSLMNSCNFLLSYRPQSSSFTSSHATSHLGMATFYFLTLKPFIKKWAWLFFLWAGLICYAQVYVGVHYPLDVICGGIIGSMIGYLFAVIFNKKFVLS